jgi:hypothetical protein
MKLAQTTAPNTSDVRLPSMKPNTSPQIMPSGRPFRNIAATFHGTGISANSTSAKVAAENGLRNAYSTGIRGTGRIS